MDDQSPQWTKSSFCNADMCVEVARVAGGVWIRDSKLAVSPVLTFTAAEWEAFRRALIGGKL